MKKLKVWAGMDFRKKVPQRNGSTQTRTLVAATTKKRAAELVGWKMHEFNGYWTEIGNTVELAIACEEGVWANQGAEFEQQYERVIIN